MIYKSKDERCSQELTGFLRNKTIANITITDVTSFSKYEAKGTLVFEFTDGASFALSSMTDEKYEFSVFFAPPAE
jgi:hypothetical protein